MRPFWMVRGCRVDDRLAALNYVYVHEITAESLGGPSPQVLQSRRPDNGPAEVVEIVLDRSIPTTGGTRFFLSDGAAVNVVTYLYSTESGEFTLPPADADLDLDVDLRDAARLQSCFSGPPPGPEGLPLPCRVFDLDADNRIDAADVLSFPKLLTGPT